MGDLIAKSPCAGLLPLTHGAVTATEVDPGPVTLIQPLRGGDLSGLPGPNRTANRNGARLLWFGRGQALLIGAVPDAALAQEAALVDVSDAYAWVRLDGAGAEAVLARLIPLDLRAAAFPPGTTARTEIAHMTGSVTRLDDGGFLLAVFRSMAATLVHDLQCAMRGLAARGQGVSGLHGSPHIETDVGS